MVAFNFKEQFAEDVEYSIKTQTIRAKARCKAGDTLQLYTGMRTKKCRKLKDVTCTKVTPIKIDHTGMSLNGQPVYAGDAPRGSYEDYDNDFAKLDGFESFTDMADWFHKQYTLPFEGFVIYWR